MICGEHLCVEDGPQLHLHLGNLQGRSDAFDKRGVGRLKRRVSCKRLREAVGAVGWGSPTSRDMDARSHPHAKWSPSGDSIAPHTSQLCEEGGEGRRRQTASINKAGETGALRFSGACRASTNSSFASSGSFRRFPAPSQRTGRLYAPRTSMTA